MDIYLETKTRFVGGGGDRLFVSRKISMHSLYVWAHPEKRKKSILCAVCMCSFLRERGRG